jgi:exodeoxyribonuclease V beta subunit
MEFLVAARRVETRALDRWIGRWLLPGAQRPALRETRINGMLKGFIDLVFCHRGRYYLLDYKSNHLGEDGAAYRPAALAECMLEHRYDLQAALYTLALHRLLKARLAGYDYQREMGGALYLFLRGLGPGGQGSFAVKPPAELIARLDAAFAGQGGDDAAR